MNLQQAQVIKAIPFVKNQQLEESKQKPLANSLKLFDKVDIFNQISIRRKSIIPQEEVDKIIDKKKENNTTRADNNTNNTNNTPTHTTKS